MNKPVFLKFFSLALAFTIIPFFGGLAIGKTTEIIANKPQSNLAISSVTTEAQASTQALAETPEVVEDTTPETTVTPETSPPSSTKPQPTNPTPKVAGANVNPAPPQVSCSGTLAQAFLCLLNQYRTEKGLGKISYNSTLNQVAFNHSSWMNTTGTFSHTGINGSRMIDRCAAAGTICLAENLAENILESQKLLSSWKANPGHNKNLLGPYTVAGFGVSGPYVTLIFN